MVLRIFRNGLIRHGKFGRLHNQVARRGICRTEWTKPKQKQVDKPYTERRNDLQLFVNKPRTKTVLYAELRKAWFTIEYDLYNAYAKNGNFFAIRMSQDPLNNTDLKTNNSKQCDILIDESKKQNLNALLYTLSDMLAYPPPNDGKSGFVITEEKGPVKTIEATTLNTTTKNIQEDERLEQKIETIEEVPLVEADPNIIKPPKTTGPTVMNYSPQENPEESSKLSDFQIGEDYQLQKPTFVQMEPLNKDNEENTEQEDSNIINNYFKKPDSKKHNFSDIMALNTVPEIKANEEVSLTELMQRVRQRNRLLRCRDIDNKLNTTSTGELDTTMDDKDRFRPDPHNTPLHNHPGWGLPHGYPQYHPQRQPTPWFPQTSPNNPGKAEPITPDSRPGFHRSTKVNPVGLALYIGPLVTALRNSAILFPLLIANLVPKDLTENTTDSEIQNFWCILRSKYEKKTEKENRLNVVEAQDYLE